MCRRASGTAPPPRGTPIPMTTPVSPLPPLTPSTRSARAGMPSIAGNTTGTGWTAENDSVSWCERRKSFEGFSSDDSSVHEFSDRDLGRSESNSRRNSLVGGQPSEVHPPVGLVPPATAVRLANAQARLSTNLRIEVDHSFHFFPGSLAGSPGSLVGTEGAGTNYSCGTPTTPTTPGMLVFFASSRKKTYKKKKSRRPHIQRINGESTGRI